MGTLTVRNSPIVGVLLVALAACSHGRLPNPAAKRSPATTSSTSSTSTASAPTTAAPAVAIDGCPSVPPRSAPRDDRPRYTLAIDVRPADDLVTGDETVVFTPDLATDHLVFRLWPNGPRLAPFGARLDVGSVTVDGAPRPATRPDPTTLIVPLPATAAAGRPIAVAMAWRLHLASPADDRVTHVGDGVRLGSFFPLLPWEPGVGWATEPPTSAYAEASTAPAADIDFTVTVPPGYSVLASGEADTARPGHFVARGMRDVAVSVGHFRVATAVAHAPQPVPVTVGVAADVAESPQPYLDKAVKVLAAHSARFGPYPWPAFTLALTSTLHGGIEYPGHVMQGPHTLGRTTSHELGHQWFYALVGDDQGRDPWLDEAPASWAEARYEDTLATFVNRFVPSDARGRLTEPMTYWEAHRSSYYAGVYVQGVQALAAAGPPAMVDCALAHFAAKDAYAIARPADLLAILDALLPGASSRMARFGAVAR